MPTTRFEDALADLATPVAYVPRPDMERARRVLEAALAAGGRPALLTGEPGSGKTLLLRRLAASPPPGVRAVYVPFLHLGPDEFAPWLLFLMGEDGPEEPAAAERRLLERVWAQAAGGWRTWLLIDESPSLPRATASRLAQLMERCGGHLALALAATSRSAVREVLDCFGGPSASADLSGGGDAEETHSYVQALVSRAAPEERERALRAAARLGPLAERLPRDVKAELLLRWRELGSGPPADDAPPEELELPVLPPEPLPPEPVDVPAAPIPEPPRAPEISVTPMPGPPRATDVPATPPPEALVRAIQEIEAELDLAETATALPELPVTAPEQPPAPPPIAPAPRRAPPPGAAAVRRRRPAPGPERGPRPAPRPDRASRRRIAPLVGALAAVGLIAFGLRHLGPRLQGPAPAAAPPAPVAAPASTTLPAPGPSAAPPPERTAPAPQAVAPPVPIAVNVNAAPWARIRVDGREVGVTPLGGVPLDPGAHDFRATFPDGRVVVRSVVISPSKRFVVFR